MCHRFETGPCHHFFISLPDGHHVRLFCFPVLSVDFQRFAKSEKNEDSPFATISDADSLILQQILRLSRVRDTWIIIQVSFQTRVIFSIAEYRSEAWCEVLPLRCTFAELECKIFSIAGQRFEAFGQRRAHILW